jgi:hypothetical protein
MRMKNGPPIAGRKIAHQGEQFNLFIDGDLAVSPVIEIIIAERRGSPGPYCGQMG